MNTHAPLILGCEGLRLNAKEIKFFRALQPWGFCLFGRNLESHAQIKRLCAELRAAVGWHAPIFIDQEGGRVQRLRAPLAREWPAPFDHVAKSGERAAEVMALRAQIIAAELQELGIDGNFMPCLDVWHPDTHPILANRCLSADPQQVAKLGQAIVSAMLSAGCLPVIKHMPGHGRGTVDSHIGLPSVEATLSELRASEFMPFAACKEAPLGMTAHVAYTALDPRPATLSERMITLIRQEIGFQGLLMTDDLSMEALPGDIASRAQAALGAGCDLVLHCNGNLNEMRAIADQLPELTPQGAARARKALCARDGAFDVDIARLIHKLEVIEIAK